MCDVDVLDLRHHGDGRRRRVDPALRLGLGDTLHAVRPALVLEDRVRTVSLDREDDVLVAAGLVLVGGENLGLVAAALRIAGEHAVDVAGPERRLVAADARTDLDDHVLRVRRIALHEREPELVLQPRQLLLQLGRHTGELGVALGVGEIGLHLAPLLREAVRAFELLPPPPDLSGIAMVVVDGRVGHALLDLRVGALELFDEWLDAGHGRRC